jgi:hypothetical protein
MEKPAGIFIFSSCVLQDGRAGKHERTKKKENNKTGSEIWVFPVRSVGTWAMSFGTSFSFSNSRIGYHRTGFKKRGQGGRSGGMALNVMWASRVIIGIAGD